MKIVQWLESGSICRRIQNNVTMRDICFEKRLSTLGVLMLLILLLIFSVSQGTLSEPLSTRINELQKQGKQARLQQGQNRIPGYLDPNLANSQVPPQNTFSNYLNINNNSPQPNLQTDQNNGLSSVNPGPLNDSKNTIGPSPPNEDDTENDNSTDNDDTNDDQDSGNTTQLPYSNTEPSKNNYSIPPQTPPGSNGSRNPGSSKLPFNFEEISSAKEESKKNGQIYDTSFLGKPFLAVRRPVSGEVIPLGSVYEIKWDGLLKGAPAGIDGVVATLGKGKPSDFQRTSVNSNPADVVTKQPILLNIPTNIPEGEYTIEYLGLTKGRPIISAGPQYSDTFTISQNAPGMFSRIKSSVKGIVQY